MTWQCCTFVLQSSHFIHKRDTNAFNDVSMCVSKRWQRHIKFLPNTGMSLVMAPVQTVHYYKLMNVS